MDPARRQGYMTTEVLQSYWGEEYEANYQRLKTLLEPLVHTVLLYDGAPAAACYHAISSGRTEASQRVWNEALPYLQGVDSPLDKLAEGYQETVSYTTQQMYDILATQFAGLDLSGSADGWFGETSLTEAGYVDTVQVGGAFVKGTQLRAALSLRSSCFTIQRTEDGFDVTTLGYGHGVGPGPELRPDFKLVFPRHHTGGTCRIIPLLPLFDRMAKCPPGCFPDGHFCALF